MFFQFQMRVKILTHTQLKNSRPLNSHGARLSASLCLTSRHCTPLCVLVLTFLQTLQAHGRGRGAGCMVK